MGSDTHKNGRRELRRGRWTDDEVERLRLIYGLRSDETIARDLGRTVDGVRRMAARIFQPAVDRGPWDEDEVEKLKRYIGGASTEVIARVLGRSEDDVQGQIDLLARVRRTGRWSRDELLLLRQIYGTRTDDDLATVFGRSVESVRRAASKLALSKDKAFVRRLEGESATRMPRWASEELDLLRELYPTCPNLDIAHRVGRSVKSVVSKAHHLGLRKDPSRLREMGRENVAQRYRGARRQV
ncbi:hypothetical protein [Engelhardtia mirabilis]|uniref:hypothetical protein n=1 Tax=Engelhardtia mirabilis TaxID=2528011 RepID=UPI00119D6ADB